MRRIRDAKPLHGRYEARIPSARATGLVGQFLNIIFGSAGMKHRAFFGCLAAAFAVVTAAAYADDHDGDHDRTPSTRTPIKHLVVIFQENISYDHYFGTYPQAQNNSGETPFKAKRRTPINNNLLTPLDVNNGFKPLVGVNLLTNNPNNNPGAPVAPNSSRQNAGNAANPFRLSPSQATTADQGHNEQPEQSAYNNGNMDGFPAWTGTAGTAASGPLPPPAAVTTKGLVMGYYDGNTVTALWNYAQHYAMNDNSYSTQFGPSSPGAINLISGQSNGFASTTRVLNTATTPPTLLHPTHEAFGDANKTASNLTMIGDADPEQDTCSNPTIDQVTMAGRNVGDLLNQRNITWGWFEGGFNLQTVNPNGSTLCARFTPQTTGASSTSTDYIPHHQPFQYYASTRNASHARPNSVASIGFTNIPNTHTPDPANHQYDSDDFFAALSAGNLPSVTFLKAPAFQDGHAGYSNPLDEQHFIVKTVNALQQSKFWKDTAIVILYDDSDGWYDHQMPPIVNSSFNPDPNVDTLNGPGVCNMGLQQGRPVSALNGNMGNSPAWGRCGYGTRQPLLVISPFAKRNHVDHTLTDQASVLKFIEDNWLSGERIQPGGSMDTIAGTIENMFDFDRDGDGDDRKLILDPQTGAVVSSGHDDDDDHDDDHDGHH
jgi:phospholipase C